MRGWLIPILCLAGCLHAQGPAMETIKDDPAALATFQRLLGDAETIDDAALFAEKKGLSRGSVISRAERTYLGFMKTHRYAPAAEIAWRFRADPSYISIALDFARKDMMKRVSAWEAGRAIRSGYVTGLRTQAERALAVEVIIACRYSTNPEAGRLAINDAYTFCQLSWDNRGCFILLDAGCPVNEMHRIGIIESAISEGMDAYAIRHAAASKWDDQRQYTFLAQFFTHRRCSVGFRAAVVLHTPSDDLVSLIENSECEHEQLNSRGWNLSADDAGRYFFVAVRKRKYHLALELLKIAGFGEDVRARLFQEVLDNGYGGPLAGALWYDMAKHHAFMAYAYGHGRHRFVATYALTHDWQRKAFDKLIEFGKWQDAAEAAHIGVDMAFRTEGILIAFRAAMAAGDFKAGRYFLDRYGPIGNTPGIITQEMYEEEWEKYYEIKKASMPPTAPLPPPALKRKQNPRASSDWRP